MRYVLIRDMILLELWGFLSMSVVCFHGLLSLSRPERAWNSAMFSMVSHSEQNVISYVEMEVLPTQPLKQSIQTDSKQTLSLYTEYTYSRLADGCCSPRLVHTTGCQWMLVFGTLNHPEWKTNDDRQLRQLGELALSHHSRQLSEWCCCTSCWRNKSGNIEIANGEAH